MKIAFITLEYSPFIQGGADVYAKNDKGLEKSRWFSVFRKGLI